MKTDSIGFEGLGLGALSAGASYNPGLVLLHGWPHNNRLYDRVIDQLAESHHVLALDLPAIGSSRGNPPSAEKTVLANIVLGAAERAGLRSIVIVGVDIGGMVAYAAARDHGERIRGAVVINTVIPGIDPWEKILSDPRIWHFAFHNIPQLPEHLVHGRQRAYFDFFTRTLAGNPGAIDEAHRSAFVAAYQSHGALKAGFDWYRAMPLDAQHNRRHRTIGTPMLYLRGDADGRSPDDYLPGLKAAGASNIEGRTLKHCGEFAPLEAPQAFVEAVAGFARSCV
jgi:pimeloyl-ACP methyl ester carboxylesterase